jgi:hypothetical protein
MGWWLRAKVRQPDSGLNQLRSLGCQDVLGGTVSQETAGRIEHDDSIGEIPPQIQTMLDEDDRGSGRVSDELHCLTHELRAFWIEIGCGLIQQKQAGFDSQGTCQCQPLLLAARKRSGRMIQVNIEPDELERVTHARPNAFCRHTEVFATERYVITDALQNGLRLGILQDKTNPADVLTRILPVDSQCAR